MNVVFGKGVLQFKIIHFSFYVFLFKYLGIRLVLNHMLAAFNVV